MNAGWARSLAAAAVLLTTMLNAQTPPAFRAETRLVVLHAMVTNRRGALVLNLDRDAFTVHENGVPQPITLFRRDDVPASIGLVLDNSGSMRALRARVEAAALAFARASNLDDELFVVNFADTARVDMPMTRDRDALEAGIARLDAIGGTGLRDALSVAMTYLNEHGRWDRKALLAITDGIDNASAVNRDTIRRLAEQSNVAIFGIVLAGTGDPSPVKRARQELDDLAERTGGSVAYPHGEDPIATSAVTLARQIRSQYTIGYAPSNQTMDGSYRRIRVTVRGQGRPVVRTRPGYWATAPPS